MGKRRNIDKTDKAVKATRLTAAQVARIVKLHDVPVAVSQISREVGVPIDMVRKVLIETFPVDVNRWPM